MGAPELGLLVIFEDILGGKNPRYKELKNYFFSKKKIIS